MELQSSNSVASYLFCINNPIVWLAIGYGGVDLINFWSKPVWFPGGSSVTECITEDWQKNVWVARTSPRAAKDI